MVPFSISSTSWAMSDDGSGEAAISWPLADSLDSSSLVTQLDTSLASRPLAAASK
jgi:hypothetical protein